MGRLAISGVAGPMVTVNGRRVVSFGGCNYLGLSFHPAVIGAMTRALAEFGISTSASRETTGNTVVHDQLERVIGEFLGVESVVVVPDGYTANLAAAQALAGECTRAVIDSRCHRSIREALAGAGMMVAEYAHLDAESAAAKVRELSRGGKVSVWTDGVFASDGSIAPVAALADACGRAGARLVVDDCHGLFTLGPGGRGTLSHAGVPMRGDIVVTSTLAKGVGCHGGFVAGAGELGARVRERSTAYICTTPVSPAIAAAAVEAFGVVQRERGLVERLRSNARLLHRELRASGVGAQDQGTPIFAFTCGEAQEMRALHEDLFGAGFLAPLIDYPDGPAPLYFRVSVSSGHTPEQIAALGRAVGAGRGRTSAIGLT